MADTTPLEAFRELSVADVRARAEDLSQAILDGKVALAADRREFLLGLLAHVQEDQGELSVYIRKMLDAIERSDNRTPEETAFLALQLSQLPTSDGPARRQIMEHLKHALVPKAREGESNASGYLREVATLGGRRQARPGPPPGF